MMKFLTGYLLLTALIIGMIVVLFGQEPLKKDSDITVSNALIQVVRIALHQSQLKIITILQTEKKEKSQTASEKHKQATPTKIDRRMLRKHRPSQVLKKKRAGFTATFITNYMKSQYNEVVDEDAFQRTNITVPDSDVKKEQTENSEGDV